MAGQSFSFVWNFIWKWKDALAQFRREKGLPKDILESHIVFSSTFIHLLADDLLLVEQNILASLHSKTSTIKFKVRKKSHISQDRNQRKMRRRKFNYVNVRFVFESKVTVTNERPITVVVCQRSRDDSCLEVPKNQLPDAIRAECSANCKIALLRKRT